MPVGERKGGIFDVPDLGGIATLAVFRPERPGRSLRNMVAEPTHAAG